MIKKGDRVKMTALAHEHGVQVRRGTRGRTGTVVSVGLYIGVLWDGLKTPQRYHPDYVESTIEEL